MTENVPAVSGKLGNVPAVSGDGGAPRALFLPSTFGEAMRLAEIMAAGKFVPKHLRDNPGDCLAVLMQSARWGMDPFAVAGKVYFISERMAYEAQLVAAVINSSGLLEGRLKVEWTGDGEKMVCKVSGKIKGDPQVHAIEQAIGTITTRNSPLWKQSPQMQLAYYTQRLWCRLFTPEVLLGVYTEDEVSAINDAADRSPTTLPPPLRSAKVQRVEERRGNEEAIQTATGQAQEPATAKVADAVDAIFAEQPQDGDGRLPGEQDDEQVDPETGEVVEPEAVVEQPKPRGRSRKAAAEPAAEPTPEPAATQPDPEPAKEEPKPVEQPKAKETPKVTAVEVDEISPVTNQPWPKDQPAWDSYFGGFDIMMKTKDSDQKVDAFTEKHRPMYNRAPASTKAAMEKAYNDQLARLKEMGGGSY